MAFWIGGASSDGAGVTISDGCVFALVVEDGLSDGAEVFTAISLGLEEKKEES